MAGQQNGYVVRYKQSSDDDWQIVVLSPRSYVQVTKIVQASSEIRFARNSEILTMAFDKTAVAILESFRIAAELKEATERLIELKTDDEALLQMAADLYRSFRDQPPLQLFEDALAARSLLTKIRELEFRANNASFRAAMGRGPEPKSGNSQAL